MTKRTVVALAVSLVIATALAFGPATGAAAAPSRIGTASVRLRAVPSVQCPFISDKYNGSVQFGSGHLNVYLDFYQCYNAITDTWSDQYQLYVDTSNGDLLLDNINGEYMKVRVWTCGGFKGTVYGPDQNGEFTYASDITGLYATPAICRPQADDNGSYVLDTNGKKYNLPYLNY